MVRAIAGPGEKLLSGTPITTPPTLQSSPTMTHPALIHRLTALVGRTWRHRGRCWRVIDLLPDAGLVVLESTDGPPMIQLDQFGRPSHCAPELRQILMFQPDGDGPSDELRDLLGDLDPRPDD